MSRHRPALALALPLIIGTLIAPSAFAGNPTSDVAQTKGFRKAITIEGVREHQAALQSIADANGGSRVSGFPGHDLSAQYVHDRMAAAGYDVSFQDFDYTFSGDVVPPIMQRISPAPLTYVDGVDFASMTGSGTGDVSAPVYAVDLVVPSPVANASTSGCEAADFAGFPAGSIALTQRGTCAFAIKALNAEAAGAVGTIIMNEGDSPGRSLVIFGTLAPSIAAGPTVGTSFAVGDGIRNGVLNGSTGTVVRLKTETAVAVVTTRNVIAETPGGDSDHTVVIGAHLDSVTRGPGIQDNGSGSAAILEIAEVFATQMRETRNKVRFMWYGAEESGLLGSTYYVSQLSAAEIDQVELMLNFDMIGSPNFVRFVYDGDNSAFPVGPGAAEGPPGSDAIEADFVAYFDSQGLRSAPTAFSGRSDYGPFIAVGIPAGGLFTGAEGVKTPEEAELYGGVAGVQYDPCYHLACDTYDNISLTALDTNTDAAAHLTLLYSKRNFDLNPLAPASAGASTGGSTGGGGHDDHEAVDR
jgi:Zn-dependent M28 family amino/carboxypeptidase